MRIWCEKTSCVKAGSALQKLHMLPIVFAEHKQPGAFVNILTDDDMQNAFPLIHSMEPAKGLLGASILLQTGYSFDNKKRHVSDKDSGSVAVESASEA